MKLPGLTIRRLMVVVAAVAVLFGGVTLWRNVEFYRWKVRHHRQMERLTIINVVEKQRPAARDELDRLNRLRRGYHTAMRIKYERAAARPWMYVSPDEPDPVRTAARGGKWT